jgi:hypothetical protein
MLTLRNMWCYMSVERKGVVMVFGIFSMIFSLVWFWPARKGATALQHAGMGDNLKPVPSSQLWLFPAHRSFPPARLADMDALYSPLTPNPLDTISQPTVSTPRLRVLTEVVSGLRAKSLIQ